MITAWKKLHGSAGPSPVRGYTYVGLLFLIAIMAYGLTAAAAVWATAQQRDKEDDLLHVGAEIRKALARYAADGPGFPQRLEDLLKDPRFPGVRRYLRVIPRDPLTGRTQWGLVRAAGGGIVGVHSLSTARPIKQSGFGPAERSFEGRQRYTEWIFGAREAAAAPSGPGGAVPGTPLAPGAGLRSGVAHNK